jgi:hypothetical protein
MRAPRAKASDRNETADTTNPAKSPHAEADGSTGLIRKRRKWAKATSLMGGWGPGIERHTQGTDVAAAVSFLCITRGWGIGHAEPGSGCKAPNAGRSGEWHRFYRAAVIAVGGERPGWVDSRQSGSGRPIGKLDIGPNKSRPTAKRLVAEGSSEVTGATRAG